MNFKLFTLFALVALFAVSTTDAATSDEGRMVKRAVRLSKRGDYESTKSPPSSDDYSSGSSSGDDYNSGSSSGDDYNSGSSKSSGSSSGSGYGPSPSKGGQCLYDASGNLASANTDYCPAQIIPKGGDSDPSSGDGGSTCTVNSAGKLLDADLLPCSNVCVLTKTCPKQNKCQVSDSGLIVATVLPCSNVEILTGILRK